MPPSRTAPTEMKSTLEGTANFCTMTSSHALNGRAILAPLKLTASRLIVEGTSTSLRHVQGRLALESAHLRMLSCDYPLSRRIGETVRLLANASRDADAARDALEDLRDHWVPPSGFCS